MTGLVRVASRWIAVGALALCVSSVIVEMDGHRERPGRADVAVVLGSRVGSDGRPTPGLAARLERGMQVWREGRAPVIIVSGGVERGMDEAGAMKSWLVAHGVPDSVVVTDSHGRNTWETARFTRAWLSARGGKSAIAVSQYFHLPRCRLAFARFGIHLVRTAGPDFAEWRDLYSAPREVLGLVEYALRLAPQEGPHEGGSK